MTTGSFVNHVYGRMVNTPTPEVGMGATVLMWTDRAPATIVEVVSPKTIKVQGDNAKRVDENGMSESQTYEYTPNEDGPVDTYTLRKNGRWIRKGDPMKGGQCLLVGSREKYHDFSF